MTKIIWSILLNHCAYIIIRSDRRTMISSMQLSMLVPSEYVTLWLRQALTTAMLSKYVLHFRRAVAISSASSLIGCKQAQTYEKLRKIL